MKDLYITSTFTNQWNIDFSTKLCNFLEKNSFTCYLPYRDTNQNDIRLEIFKQDIKGIEDSLIMLAVALNETPNWGAEIGYAYSIRKPIIVITNKDHVIPLICEGMIDEIIRIDDLDLIENYINNIFEKIKFYANKERN